MRERPILMSGPMVRAVFEGRKTQTRRVVKNPARLDGLMLEGEAPDWCPHGRPGDRLWVRWTHWHYTPATTNPANEQVWDEISREVRWPCGRCVLDAEPDTSRARWTHRPSIHMPRWASRLTLEITDVRVQRLQEISEEDAKAEGVTSEPQPAMINGERGTVAIFNPRYAFAVLWDSLQLKRKNPAGLSWADSPWVWAISFGRVEA